MQMADQMADEAQLLKPLRVVGYDVSICPIHLTDCKRE